MPKDLYLVLTLLREKYSTLAQDGNRKSISDKEYHKIVDICGQAIKKDANDIHSVLAFAVLYNLHENKNHAAAAMVSFEQLNDVLDQNQELEERWHQMLNVIREMKEKLSASQSEVLHYVSEMADMQNGLQANNMEELENMLNLLLAEKLSDLQKIDTSRSAIKVDEKHFANDPNNNRSFFYKKMRSSLSHKFTAMAVTSGDGGDPIVKHDRTGTESK